MTVRVNFNNGDHLITRFNGTIEQAENYYVGNVFNIGSVQDDMQKAVSVRQIYTEGDKITHENGSVYLVEKVYQITEDYMRKYDLYYKNRVKLVKLSGEGIDSMDFAVTENN